MKLCNRCPLWGACALKYLGKACVAWRKERAPHVVLTNADCIRDMSDEELAQLMFELIDGPKLEIPYLEWLQQPVEED